MHVAAKNKLVYLYPAAWKPSFADVQFGPFHLLHDSEGRLQCNPSAAPRPSFQWLRNGVAISNGDNSRYELQQDGTLVIKKADKVLDAAKFTCKATNFLGEDSATTTAIVFGKILCFEVFLFNRFKRI